MSDHWIALVPLDPLFVPDAKKQLQARDRFAEIAPESGEIEIKLSDNVEFYDCGENLERICCPCCNEEIPLAWWQDRMDDDNENGFKLDVYATPCCGKKLTLNELIYDWPQAFGRFAIDAMNPNIGLLEDIYKREFEQILGTKLRVIHQHI